MLAAAYLATTRAEENVYQGYYKDLNKLGYEKSFEVNFGITLLEFYKEFDEFHFSVIVIEKIIKEARDLDVPWE